MEVSKQMVKFGLLAIAVGVLALAAWLVKSGIRLRVWHSLVGFAVSIGCIVALEVQSPEPPFNWIFLVSSAVFGLVSVAVLFAARRVAAES